MKAIILGLLKTRVGKEIIRILFMELLYWLKQQNIFLSKKEVFDVPGGGVDKHEINVAITDEETFEIIDTYFKLKK